MKLRITIRKLMILIAVVAVIVFGFVLRKKSYDYQALAERHDEISWHFASIDEASMASSAHLPITSHRIEAAAYHQRMKAKYERAARYPWLPVAPDPPEPR